MMHTRTVFSTFLCAMVVLATFILSACSPSASSSAPAAAPATPAETTSAGPTPSSTKPDWFDFELTDVRTGEAFTINDFAGKVVLLEAMAVWCPTCIFQQSEVRELHELLGDPDDLVSITLDVDRKEEATLLAEYATEWGFDGHFAVSTLEVNRALGNLYSAQYLNPPLSPMLLIDREGNTYSLPYGKKDAETLREFVEPYLSQ